jgi:hypothetical protein
MALDFRKATDELLDSISHQKLAKDLGVSVATVRQARLDESAKAHRNPPEHWQLIVATLARKRAERLKRLADSLKY